MSNPKISIIVPVYNTEKYLRKCIESILNQTYTNLELLLVDDGSTDESGNICDEYLGKDKRVRVFHLKNGGQANARNHAMKQIQGDYVAFVDSDDWIEHDMYMQLMAEAIKHPGSVAMCGRFNVNEITEEATPSFDFEDIQIWTSEEAIKRFLLWDKIDGSPCDKLFPKNLIMGEAYSGTLICEDLPFVYNIIKKASKIIHIGTPKYYYLQRNGSTSKSTYSEKSKGLVVYPKAIYEDVTRNFPSLIIEAQYYYFKQLLMYLELFYTSQKGRNVFDKELSANLLNIIKHPYITNKEKVKGILFASNLFRIIHKIRKYK